MNYAGINTEDEYASNVETNAGLRLSYRTSCLKDWWDGSTTHVNDLYTFSTVADGWQATIGDLTKTITLAPSSTTFEVQYTLSGGLAAATVYVRNGLSPNLADLLVHGQDNLGTLSDDGQVVSLTNSNGHIRAVIDYAGGSHSATYNVSAVDDDAGKGVEFSTLNMRNQAQIQQIELAGTGSFSFGLGFDLTFSDFDNDGIPDDVDPDDDNDGIPDDWEIANGLNPMDAADAALDSDGDNVNNLDEYLADTNPFDGSDYLRVLQVSRQGNDVHVRFPSKIGRFYYLWYADEVSGGMWNWQQATPNSNAWWGTDGDLTFIDDGSETSPPPDDPAVNNRMYHVEARTSM